MDDKDVKNWWEETQINRTRGGCENYMGVQARKLEIFAGLVLIVAAILLFLIFK